MTIAQQADAPARHPGTELGSAPVAPQDPAAAASGSADKEAGDRGEADPRTTDSFATLVQHHQSMVWRYLRLLGADPHEADDLMQDAFVRLAEGLGRGEPVLSPPAYLRGIARNLLIARRRRQRQQAPTVAWADAVDRLAIEPHAFDDARVAALRRCIDRLGGRVRSAVEWHHVEGLSYREAARRLGIKEHGIKSLLGRARDALRACIERQLAQEERQ